jgi:hypothetical protein
MKTIIIAITLASGAAGAATAAAMKVSPAHGLTFDVVSTSGGQEGPPQVVMYQFLPGGRFAQDDAIGLMTITDTTITLGEEFDDPALGTRFSAIVINKGTGHYHWEARGPGWSTVTTGHCRGLPR